MNSIVLTATGLLLVFFVTACRSEEQGLDTSLQSLADNTGDFFRSLQNDVKIVDDEPTGAVTGRGKKYNKLAIGLVIGIKFLTMVYSFMMAVKALALKALLISKFGLITTIVVGIKYMMDKMKEPMQEVTPYHSMPQQWAPAPMWSGGWSEMASGSELSQSTVDHGAGGGGYGSGGEITHAISPEEVGASELQAHVANIYQGNYAAPKSAERKTQTLLPMKYKTTVYKTTIKKYEQ